MANQEQDATTVHLAEKFPLLRRILFTCVLAMFITAAAAVYLYRTDQLAEYQTIAALENTHSLTRLAFSLDGQLNAFISSTNKIETSALGRAKNIDLLLANIESRNEERLESRNQERWLKVKLYDLSGRIVLSSAKVEIGTPSRHPELVQKALRGEASTTLEHRDIFLSSIGEMRDIYIAETLMPLTHLGKRIGVIEIYSDTTPLFQRVRANTIKIVTLLASAFSVLFLAIFFVARRTDQDVSKWQKLIVIYNEKIRDMAFHDPLTQLPNRHLLDDRLNQTMASNKRNGIYSALMFLDLDNFKPLNDKHGHGVGDLLLKEVARRLIGCVREVDTVARIGGDEFVVMLKELGADKSESTKQANLVAEKILSALAAPYEFEIVNKAGRTNSARHDCTSSIGVVVFMNHEVSSAEILKRADFAMYQAKESGRNQIRFYEAAV